MKTFETLDRFVTPDGQNLTFHRRDGDSFVYLDGEELMSSRAPGSERALAELSCAHLSGRPRVLVGGLGLGFTLRAALDVLPPAAEVVVAEVFACVIEWNRKFVPDLQGDALTDPRTRIVHVDVREAIRGDGPWDAILLDVDNGPEACCLESNQRLYDRRGLQQILEALAPRGVAAFWSSQRNDRFLKDLRKSGFDACSTTVRSRGDRGSRHTVFLAARDRLPSTARPPR